VRPAVDLGTSDPERPRTLIRAPKILSASPRSIRQLSLLFVVVRHSPLALVLALAPSKPSMRLSPTHRLRSPIGPPTRPTSLSPSLSSSLPQNSTMRPSPNSSLEDPLDALLGRPRRAWRALDAAPVPLFATEPYNDRTTLPATNGDLAARPRRPTLLNLVTTYTLID